MRPVQGFRLFRPGKFAAPDAADCQVHVLITRRIGKTQKSVRLADGVEPSADSRRHPVTGLLLKKPAHRRHGRGEGRNAMIFAPAHKDLEIGMI